MIKQQVFSIGRIIANNQTKKQIIANNQNLKQIIDFGDRRDPLLRGPPCPGSEQRAPALSLQYTII